MEPAPINFDVRPVIDEAGEVGKIVALFRDTVPDSPSTSEAYIRWLYFENPAGPIIGFNAWDGGNLAAHYVVMPTEAECAGRRVKAALSLNTATHPNYQRRGLFVRLAEATYDECRRRGLHHIIGVANANSTPGFLSKLRFQEVGRLEAVVGLGVPGVGPEPEGTCWKRVWNERDLAWRLRNPAGAYKHSRSGECGVVLASTGTLGIACVLKIEGDPALRDVVKAALPGGGHLGPKLWIGLSRRIRPGAASLEVPERFRASPLNLIFRPLLDDTVLDRETVEFEAIDFDAF
jgi:GNAT superfamily N-acetyltransferase